MTGALSGVVIKGIRAAFNQYKKWSDGQWLVDAGVENMMQVQIASELWKHQKDKRGFVRLESKFSDIGMMSGATGSGNRPKEIEQSRRADICIFKGDSPIGIVEVKRKWTTASCVNDLKRLAALIKHYGPSRNGSIECGYLAFYSYSKGSLPSVRKRIRKIESEIKDPSRYPNRFNFTIEVSHQEWRDNLNNEEYAHSAIVIQLSPS